VEDDGNVPQGTQVLLCFDLSDKVWGKVLKGFQSCSGEDIRKCPFGIYNPLTEAITLCYDEALWGFRRPIRDIERVRLIILPSRTSCVKTSIIGANHKSSGDQTR
jgi:hypothetical protein